MIILLRHIQTVQREEDGAIQFWRIKFHLRNHFSQVQHWSDERWKSCLAAGGGSKRSYQYCYDSYGTILYVRALQGHSGRNLIDPMLQDNVIIQRGLFHHIYHIGCAFNLHSIINSGLVPGGQESIRRQTIFFLTCIGSHDQFQNFKYGIEIRIELVNQDDSHSWARNSYGTVKYVIDSFKDNTEDPTDPQEEQVSQTSTNVVAAKSKAKAKPQPRELAGTTATIPIHQRRWIDIEPSKQDLVSYDLSEKVINLLRHNQTLHREEDGAIQFNKIKFHLRNHLPQIQNWSDDRWKACLAAHKGSKKEISVLL